MAPNRPPGLSAAEAFPYFMPGEPPPPDKCWIWTRTRLPKGYGTLRCGVRRRQVYAHRASYERFHGPIQKGAIVRHSCDNPSCVQPAHLSIGTQADNIRDCIDRGRKVDPPHIFGTATNTARLTESDVRLIRELYATGQWRQVDLAERFKVRQTNISEIVRRATWKHIA